ncbi:MAG: ABC transporter permease subunit [Pseudomonadota bacterium]
MAEHAPNAHLARRHLIDRLTTRVVSFGGITVLATIVAIFLYLLFAALPIFSDARITPAGGIALPPRDTRLVDFNENADALMRVSTDGSIEFFGVADGAALAAYTLGAQITQVRRVEPTLDTYALLDNRGLLWFVRVDYRVDFVAAERKVRPRAAFAFGPQPVAFGQAQMLDAQLDNANNLLIAGASAQRITLLGYDDVESGIPLLNPRRTTVLMDQAPQHLSIGPRNEWLYAVSASNRMQVLAVNNFDFVEELFRTQIAASGARIDAIAPLVGRRSLVISSGAGNATQWSVQRDDLGFRLQPIRSFDTSGRGLAIVAEPRRKGFALIHDGGTIDLLYPASERLLTSFEGALQAPLALGMAPRANLLAFAYNDRVMLFELDNPHPEISLASLLTPTWYEGYKGPVFSWQSSSADIDFEPKFSIVPLLFGTLKAAFYALLFALPLAVLGAIYTAHYLSPSMRAWIKPSIETMAALPTVVLGFLGGLWLAPIVEDNLSETLNLLVALPLSLAACALLWSTLPRRLIQRIEGWQPLLVIPVLAGTAVIAILSGEMLEAELFAGDSRLWLRDELGLDYAQRNALVVGMVMGLAVIPTIYAIAEDAIHNVPGHLITGSLALGASRWQTLTRVVLLTAGPGIFSAIMVGIGRAVGETMIVLMATGNTPILEFNVFEGMRTFASNIAVELPESDVASTHYRLLFLSALALFIITFFFNTIAEVVRERLRTHYGNL